MAATDLSDVADNILASVLNRFQTAGVGLPGRRYTHAGQVADDCEQLVVTLTAVFAGLPASEHTSPVNIAAPISARFEVRIVRCVPTLDDHGNPPSPDRLNGSAQEILTDHIVLARAIVAAAKAGDYGDHCQGVTLDDVAPIDPSGSYGGTRARFSVGII